MGRRPCVFPRSPHLWRAVRCWCCTAVRFCPSVTAASPRLSAASSPLYGLMAHIQRWMRSTCEYAVKGLGEDGERWMQAGMKEGDPVDMSALMEFCWAMAERVPRDVTWEKLRVFAHG